MKTKSLFYLVILLLFLSCGKKDYNVKTFNNLEQSNPEILEKLKIALEENSLGCYKIVPQYFNKSKTYLISGLKNLNDGQKLSDYLSCDFDNDGNEEIVAFVNCKVLQKNEIVIFNIAKQRINLISDAEWTSGDANQLLQNFPTKRNLDWMVIKNSEIDCMICDEFSEDNYGVLINDDSRNNNGIYILYSDGKYKVEYHTE